MKEERREKEKRERKNMLTDIWIQAERGMKTETGKKR